MTVMVLYKKKILLLSANNNISMMLAYYYKDIMTAFLYQYILHGVSKNITHFYFWVVKFTK